MNNTESTLEEEQSITTFNSTSTANEITPEQKQAPLMRYFTAFDESTESYVLGYN
jgi:hypothetical protein